MHAHGTQTGKILKFSLAATLVYIAVTLAVGIRANSLALISEAGHNLSDFLALLLSWVAVYFQERPPDPAKTFGYSRAGVLAAFVNALSLIVIACFIFYEAYERLISPVVVQPRMMMWVAGIGVVMNGAIAFMLLGNRKDVNIRSVFVHEIGDTLSTAAVLLGGWVIMETGRAWVDPALSVGIGVMIVWSSVGIIRETLNILLEGTPRGLKLEEIQREICSCARVLDVHDLHVWSIGSEVNALSCHILIADIPPSESDAILCEVTERLEQQFHIHHTTIQFEHVRCEVAAGCVMPTPSHSHSGHRH